jgi:hypothetical protein
VVYSVSSHVKKLLIWDLPLASEAQIRALCEMLLELGILTSASMRDLGLISIIMTQKNNVIRFKVYDPGFWVMGHGSWVLFLFALYLVPQTVYLRPYTSYLLF